MKTIILDFETSGLNPYHCDIIEIGAKIVETGDTFSSLIRPKSETPISQKITEITGITNREIRKECREKGWNYGGWYDGYAEFYFWLMEHAPDINITIVSHNGTTFDFLILKQMMIHLEKGGGDIDAWKHKHITWIDTLLLAKRLMISQEYFRQSTLCKRLGIPAYNEHRALDDVFALEKLYTKLVSLSGIKNPYSLKNYIDLNDS